MEHKNRRSLIDSLDDYGFKIGVEVGVRTGQFSKYILDNTNLLKLYSIDPWENNAELSNCEVIYEFARNLLKPYSDRCEMIKAYSPAICDIFDDNSIDFVYIDGLHTYEAVRDDLNGWYTKIKKGGIISGHDFDKTDWPGVVQAVKEFADKHKLIINVTGADGIKPINPRTGRAKEVQTGNIGEFDGYQPSYWMIKQ